MSYVVTQLVLRHHSRCDTTHVVSQLILYSDIKKARGVKRKLDELRRDTNHVATQLIVCSDIEKAQSVEIHLDELRRDTACVATQLMLRYKSRCDTAHLVCSDIKKARGVKRKLDELRCDTTHLVQRHREGTKRQKKARWITLRHNSRGDTTRLVATQLSKTHLLSVSYATMSEETTVTPPLC